MKSTVINCETLPVLTALSVHSSQGFVLILL